MKNNKNKEHSASEDIVNFVNTLTTSNNMKSYVQKERHFKEDQKENKKQFVITQSLIILQIIITLTFALLNYFNN